MKIVCFYLQKGGVGKSTLTASFSFEFAKHGKTLIIDTDNQGSISNFFLSSIPEEKTFLKVLKKEIPFSEGKIKIRNEYDDYKGLYLLGTRKQDGLNSFLSTDFRDDPELLEDLLSSCEEDGFDYVFFDLSPTFDFFKKRVLKNCDVVIPIVEPEDAAINEFKDFAQEMDHIKKRFNKTYQSSNYLIINKINKAKDVHNSYVEILKNNFNTFEFIDSKIVSKAINQKLTLQEYDNSSKLCKIISELTEKLI